MTANRISKYFKDDHLFVDVPVYSGLHRVLFLKTPNPVGKHDVVTAVAIEQSLAGRGATIIDAVQDLFQTITEHLVHEIVQPTVEYKPDSDPMLDNAYTSDALEFEGATILRRQQYKLTIVRRSTNATRAGKGRKNRLVHELEAVAA